jgi:hypothetical protein
MSEWFDGYQSVIGLIVAMLTYWLFGKGRGDE